MKLFPSPAKSWALLLLLAFSANLSAQEPAFESELFSSGTLVYTDDFDGEFNRERRGAPKKDKEIVDGTLIVKPLFTSDIRVVMSPPGAFSEFTEYRYH